jgi:hypothetical protein
MNTGEIVVAPEISSLWAIGNIDNNAGVIIDRLDDTYAKAEAMLERLVGPDGETGFLGAMSTAIEEAPVSLVVAPVVDTSVLLETSGLTLPAYTGILSDFPDDVYPVPTMEVLPAIDTSDLGAIPEPAEADATFVWAATTPSTVIYDAILARMLTDLQAGATGLDPIVEQAIFDRARARQQVARDAAYQKLNNDISGRGFTLPPGALLSALTDFDAEGVRQDAEINNNIIVTQGDLAQKNSQFMMQQATALEQIIRQSTNESDKNALEAAKSKATLLVQDYAERVRAYVAVWEGKKARVQAQAEALKGVIEGNKGLVEIFKAQYDALKTRVEATASRNKGVIDAYIGEVQGFSEAEKAIGVRNSSQVSVIQAKIAAADLELRAAITNAGNLIAGYSSEMSLRERVAADMTHVATQVVASMLGAVNMGMHHGYSSTESSSKQVSNSATLTESHSYEHDPLA